MLVVVYTADGSALLLARREPPGYWQSVTGALREGESPRDGAVRELREETGLEGTDLVDLGTSLRYLIAPAWRARYAPGVTHNVEHHFALRLPRPCAITLDPAEHATCTWLPLERAIERVASSSNRAALEHVARADGP